MRILIPVNTGIGNAVLLSPLIRTLKKSYPKCEIDLIGDNRFGANDLYRHDSDVRQVIRSVDRPDYELFLNPFLGGDINLALRLKFRRPAMRVISHRQPVRNLKNRLRRCAESAAGFEQVEVSDRHEVQVYLELLRKLGIPQSEFVQTPSLSSGLINVAREKARRFGNALAGVVVQPGAANQMQTPKKWVLSEWIALIRKISKVEKVILVGDPNEVALGERIVAEVSNVDNLIGQTSVLELIGVLDSAKTVIGVDSGVSHLASALGRDNLVLWGPTSFNRTHPVGPRTEFVSLNLTCSPCTGSRAGLLSESEAMAACAYENRCMKAISADMVFHRFMKMRSDP